MDSATPAPGASTPASVPARGAGLETYLDDCRGLVLAEIRRVVPPDTRYTGGIYGIALDYPLRGAKALRPALCIATCRMFGGGLDAVVPTAAALELFHNAFLVHDDVEDGSELRRGRPTLPAAHGVPLAVHVGDALLALAMRPLLDNTWHLGVHKTLRLLEECTTMARRSAEGQALELAWVRERDWGASERDYLHMVYLKTACYSFVTPMRCGFIAAGARSGETTLVRVAALLGIAFQIQDDLLNLKAGDRYGKELAGDLWEGKHTLVLVHALAQATEAERGEARRILVRAREEKTADEVAWLLDLVQRRGGLAHARGVAERHARRAERLVASLPVPPSVHRAFLAELVRYVVARSW